MTEAVYAEVSRWYPNQVSKCHSNLTSGARKTNETDFLNGDTHIMAATSAFGMGVDQSDVDLVIHFNLPLSLADYYQQAGRAGREGQKAKCILLYCENDYFTCQEMLKSVDSKFERKRMRQALDAMKNYAKK